jgi:hypothetical protein
MFPPLLSTTSTQLSLAHLPLTLPPKVFNELPLEFAAEVNELMSLKLEGSVG